MSVFLAAAGLVSCSSDSERYLVSGTEYCVPNALAVHAPYWVPADPASSLNSFAFSGCASRESPCPLPAVISGSVRASSGSSGWRLKDFPQDAHYRHIVEAQDTEVKAVVSGNILVLQNTRLDPHWFVWRLWPNSATKLLSEDGELQAICGSGLANPDYSKSRLKTVGCSRTVNQHGLNLQYTFRSASKVPANLPGLDGSVFSVLESWQCGQQRSNNSFKPKPLRGSA